MESASWGMLACWACRGRTCTWTPSAWCGQAGWPPSKPGRRADRQPGRRAGGRAGSQQRTTASRRPADCGLRAAGPAQQHRWGSMELPPPHLRQSWHLEPGWGVEQGDQVGDTVAAGIQREALRSGSGCGVGQLERVGGPPCSDAHTQGCSFTVCGRGHGRDMGATGCNPRWRVEGREAESSLAPSGGIPGTQLGSQLGAPAACACGWGQTCGAGAPLENRSRLALAAGDGAGEAISRPGGRSNRPAGPLAPFRAVLLPGPLLLPLPPPPPAAETMGGGGRLPVVGQMGRV